MPKGAEVSLRHFKCSNLNCAYFTISQPHFTIFGFSKMIEYNYEYHT